MGGGSGSVGRWEVRRETWGGDGTREWTKFMREE